MEDKNLLETIDRQTKELEALRNYSGNDEVVSLSALEFENKNFTIKSKIPCLDDLIGGFMPGELVVISGITKNGKTTFCVSLTDTFAEQGIESLWFSFEMPYRQFRFMFPATIPQNIFVPMSLKNSTLLWIKSKILEGILKFGIKVVFIDHLGFLDDIAKKQDRRVEIDSIVRELKRMAVELDIVIFLVHHIKKIESGTIPQFEDLKESSAVAQDSDKVLMIWREFKKGRCGEIQMTGNTKLSVEIDRHSGTYKKQITLMLKNKRFYEIDENTNLAEIASGEETYFKF
jgi:replicative DNA helicase